MCSNFFRYTEVCHFLSEHHLVCENGVPDISRLQRHILDMLSALIHVRVHEFSAAKVPQKFILPEDAVFSSAVRAMMRIHDDDDTLIYCNNRSAPYSYFKTPFGKNMLLASFALGVFCPELIVTAPPPPSTTTQNRTKKCSIWFPLHWCAVIGGDDELMVPLEFIKKLIVSLEMTETGLIPPLCDHDHSRLPGIFHLAVSAYNPNMDLLEFFRHAFPRWAHCKSKKESYYPLQSAATFAFRAKVFPFLLQCFPGATKHLSTLTILLERNAFAEQFSIAEILLSADPSLAHVRSFKTDMLPLHIACYDESNGCKLKIASLLVDIFPNAACILFEDDEIEECSPISLICGYIPCTETRGYFGCSREEHAAFVEKLIAIAPAMLSIGINLAIHACARHGSTEIMNILLAACPSSLNSVAASGLTPVQIACIFSDLQMVKFLLSKDPAFALLLPPPPPPPHQRNDTLLSLAVANDDFTVFEYLHSLYPDTIRIANGGGNIPLHDFFFSRDVGTITVDQMRFMVRAWPQSVTERNVSGMTVYEIAVAENASEEVQRYLLRAEKEVCGDICEPRSRRLRDLNFAARSGAMFLAFCAISNDFAPTIWRKLAVLQNQDMLQLVVSFL